MIRRISMVLQGFRDIALIVVSVLIMNASYGNWDNAWASFLFSIASVFLVFSIINMTLLLKKVEWKGYYYFNALAQLFPALMLTMFGLWIGPLFIILNVAIVVTLVERKGKKQEPEQPKQA